MTELQLSRRLAEILVYGHIVLILLAIVVAIFGHLEGLDVLQMVLTGTPVLAVSATTAFAHVIRGGSVEDHTKPAERTQRQMSQVVCYVLLGLIALVYLGGTWRGLAEQKEWLKVAAGVIETGLGAYVAVVRDYFFVYSNGGPLRNRPARSRRAGT